MAKSKLLDSPARLEVKIFSPFAQYYTGPAVAVSAMNAAGPFDILPFHANFLTLLSAGQVRVNTGYREYNFKIDRGLAKVSGNRVTVFVGF